MCWFISVPSAYDKATIKFLGVEADIINFNIEDYEEDLKQVSNLYSVGEFGKHLYYLE